MVHLPFPLPRLLVAALLLLAACQTAPRPDPLSLDSRLKLAETMDGGAGALGLLREAVRQRPADAALRERLALAAERAGQDGEAAQAMRDAVALQGPTTRRLLAIGRMELRAGNLAAAAEAFGEAHALAPGEAAPLSGLGLTRDLAGDHAGAQEAYRAALLRAPRDYGIRANLALSLMLGGRAAEAAEALAEAEYAPEATRRARHNLALALAASGRPDRVVRLLRLDMGPAEAEAMAQELAAVARRLDPSPPPALRRVAEAAPARPARPRPVVAREEARLPEVAAPAERALAAAAGDAGAE